MRGAVSIAAGVLAALLVFPATAPAQEREVTAGTLTASVSGDPWRLELRDARGALLREVAGSSLGPTGTLGFSADGATWAHATHVVSERRDGDAYVATLATTDPAGRRIDVHIAPDAEGVIAIEASAPQAAMMGVAFETAAGERYLGFGERSNAVDQRGRTIENHVAEGPFQPAERPFVPLFVPPAGYRPRDDATYFPIPWLLSTRGYGVLLDNDETSRFRLGSDRRDAWSVEVDADRLRLRVFAGPEPADVLRRFSERVGRQPPAAAPFYFGPWFQPSGDEEEQIAQLRAADAPASVIQTYVHYLPCGSHVGRREEARERTARAHAAGLAITTYFNPMICTDYQPTFDRARDAGVLTRNAAGEPYTYRYAVTTNFVVGQFDFFAPGATEFYGSLLQEAVDDGYDGWMEDFGEYTPLDARAADGSTGSAMHNRYVTLYHGAANAYSAGAPRPLARFNRSGWTGTAAQSQITWGGDPSTGWGFDGLESAVSNGLTMGLSGVSLWGSDVGGFFSGSEPQLTPELLVRWIQFGAASGVMRTQANGFTLPPKPEPRAQIFDRDVLPHWRRYAKLRTQLYPYLDAAQREYDRTGLPMMRHLALAYPSDPEAIRRDGEYLLGPDLLVAPVVRPGARRRELYLPGGGWIDLWRAVEFREQDGSLRLGEASVLDGGRTATLAAPLEELPLLVRAGAVLPLLSSDVDTLAGYGDDPAVVNLGDRAGRELLAFPRGRSRASLGEDGHLLSRELRGRRWRLDVRGARTRTYRLQASLATLRRPFTPCAVTLDGRARRFRWDAAERVLRVHFRTRSGTLTVRACPPAGSGRTGAGRSAGRRARAPAAG